MEPNLTASAVNDLALPGGEAHSAVSWGAVFAGAAAALAIGFVLVALAAGLGFNLASPWPSARNDFSGFTPILGASMIVVQVVSSALGGYLAGRLRTRWTNVHGHEVHFRDTAHGLLSWAVAAIAGVVLAATVLAPLTGPMTQAALSETATQAGVPAPIAADGAIANAPADPAAIRARAERAANISAQFSLFMGIGLLLGAFTASVAAAIGGLRREEMHERFWTERGAPQLRP
jgi:hypothetical protein